VNLIRPSPVFEARRPSGAQCVTLRGWLHGIRIRENFKMKEEAAAEKAVLELQVMQTAADLRSATCIVRMRLSYLCGGGFLVFDCAVTETSISDIQLPPYSPQKK
jgi:hypothetical protein